MSSLPADKITELKRAWDEFKEADKTFLPVSYKMSVYGLDTAIRAITEANESPSESEPIEELKEAIKDTSTSRHLYKDPASDGVMVTKNAFQILKMTYISQNTGIMSIKDLHDAIENLFESAKRFEKGE